MQRHGNKKYLQVLIDPNRAVLLSQYMEDNGIKALTEAARQLIYAQLKQEFPTKYAQAAAIDQRLWERSVANRVAGRKRARAKRAERTDAIS